MKEETPMTEGHVHHVLLEQRDGGAYLTILVAAGLRDECAQQRSAKQTPAPTITHYSTPITATAAIAEAFNQGDIALLRTDPAAREARQALFLFLQEQHTVDAPWALMVDDLRRYAAFPLCTP